MCDRWYIAYRLSYRDLVAMMAERGIVVSHTTIHCWVTRYARVRKTMEPIRRSSASSGSQCSRCTALPTELMTYYPRLSEMSKPLEQLVEIIWEAVLCQIESKIQERVDAALATQQPSSRISRQEPEVAHWDTGAHFIFTRDLITMIGLGRSTIDNLEKAGQFSKRIELTERCVRYKLDEIREWEKLVVDAGRLIKRRGYEHDAREEAETAEKLMRVAAKRSPKPPEKSLPYYRMRDVLRITGMTHSQVDDRIRNGAFPRWMESGHRGKQHWDRKVVDVWLANRGKR
jgi:predicted DNA-binding transcriptional regulator AlpA